MDTAGVKYKLVDIERLDDESSETIEKSKKVKTPLLTVTADTLDKVEKIRNKFKKEIGDVPTAKYETEPVDVDGKRKYKLIVTGLSTDQRNKLIAKKASKEIQKLLVKKSNLKEGTEFDLDLYLMQKRAGL